MAMKAFIYRKDTNERVDILTKVEAVQVSTENQLVFITEDGEGFSCDTKKYKIVIYNN